MQVFLFTVSFLIPRVMELLAAAAEPVDDSGYPRGGPRTKQRYSDEYDVLHLQDMETQLFQLYS